MGEELTKPFFLEKEDGRWPYTIRSTLELEIDSGTLEIELFLTEEDGTGKGSSSTVLCISLDETGCETLARQLLYKAEYIRSLKRKTHETSNPV